MGIINEVNVILGCFGDMFILPPYGVYIVNV